MIYPSISSLMKVADSKFTLVVATSKRARQLVDGAAKTTSFDSDKPVTISIHEFSEGNLTYTRRKGL